MREVIASAPGKVNLLLRAGRPVDDGYHPLFTVFEAVSLREYVAARTRRKPGISVQTMVYRPSSSGGAPAGAPDLAEELAGLPAERHLAVRAARALQPLAAARSSWGASSAGLQLTVHKTIPAAGGMAGGSADAAAALVAVNELWQLGLSPEQLQAVGRTLGADVPACLVGERALGLGRGDHMTVLDSDGSRRWWAFAFSHSGLSTPAVFREFDRLGLGESELPAALEEGFLLQAGGERTPKHLRNDLAAAALSLRPELARIGQEALAAGAEAWVISGSGPTIAALADSEEAAQAVCGAWRVLSEVSSTAVAWGPDAGARIEDALPGWADVGDFG